MQRLLLVISMIAAVTGSSHRLATGDLQAAQQSSAVKAPTDARRIDSLRGKTLRWTFTDGPAAGAIYEHTFHEDGTVEWRVTEGPAKGKSARENAYAAVKVSDDVFAVSYLAASGYTLTVVLNFGDHRIFGFASNDKQW